MIIKNYLIKERVDKLKVLREKAKKNGKSAFPNDFRRDSISSNLKNKFGEKKKEELVKLKYTTSVAGRIMRKRGPFIVIQDVSSNIQLYIDKKIISKELHKNIKDWDIGDIIGAIGVINKSNKGELYLLVKEAYILTKSIRPLPDKFHGIKDQEIRYRYRYLDLIMNKEVREIFSIRTRVISSIRKFLNELDFMEVETPILHSIPGGALAKPFVTYNNSLNIKMYLRIAPELYLKRLVVGGLERVFEINKNFRNEGISTWHNPEFTMLEFYWAFADYKDLMGITENMIRFVANETLGTTKINIGKKINIDLSEPFDCLSMRESIIKYGKNFSIINSDLDNLEKLLDLSKRIGIIVDNYKNYGLLLNKIFEVIVERKLIKPTFITSYPVEVSPLARSKDKNQNITERFELFIGGREIANGFSELNDYIEQSKRFKLQMKKKDIKDMIYYDNDYIRALEYGMPPTAGEGVGIDRLIMILTNKESIRDVLFFPLMRSLKI
ncbi:Lysine--tRNA ligase [Candidatus Portiera aleyrodidarum]|uniref:Lysine--tRNA ligase n=1 Tax=Candidatus Portiera aleyrodidarum TV TaxID=1297582 RepID=A0A8D3X8N3_9GAMM|nr:lysine--tRNA ligase [Candidatus Portiera aleyrodidarum]AGI27083.1 lysyl-tRNA synthetase (class II) [Candidatus Portiera aleyrodidarum TV]CEI59047.1 Lysine--tRNA ligase [Candidatus Portiera aleyrodidarum]